MNRRTLLKAAGTTGLFGLGAGAAAADSGSGEVTTSSCNFECCEDCQIAYCPDGCECDRYCDDEVAVK